MFNYNFDDMAYVNEYVDDDNKYKVEYSLSVEEKAEYLNSHYDTEGAIAELEMLHSAIKSGEIKENKYSGVNKKSLVSYVSKHNYKYIGCSATTYINSKDVFIMIDSIDKIEISDTYDIHRAKIKLLDYESRFHSYMQHWITKEKLEYRRNADKEYKADNSSRIKKSKEAHAILDNFDRCIVPYAYFTNNDCGYIDVEVQTVSTLSEHKFGLYTNNYGELKYNDKVLEIEDNQAIIDLAMRYGRKMAVLIEDYNEEMKKIIDSLYKTTTEG